MPRFSPIADLVVSVSPYPKNATRRGDAAYPRYERYKVGTWRHTDDTSGRLNAEFGGAPDVNHFPLGFA
jgi:hypothetical protein